MIPTRTLGDLRVSALGLGCMGMSHAYGTADPDEARATLEAALAAGVTLYDTADMYGNGANEEFLAPFVQAHRDEIVLATKFGFVNDENAKPVGLDGRPERVAGCVDGSLRRLGVDVIDLYYLHRVDPQVPVEETVGAMAEQVAAGKVRALGLSEATAEDIRKAAAVHPIAALQSEYSIFTRDVEDGPLQAAREVGAGLVPFSPLGRGLLTADRKAVAAALSGDDFRQSIPRWQGENLEANLRLVDRIDAIAADLSSDGAQVTAAQVALAWVLAQGDDIVPIPGTTRRKHLGDNLGAATVTLTAAQVAELTALSAVGERYPERLLRRR
ncbi:aldo/keto reductase [Tsukamurella tyrosinosolvens]|uniref:aldo/keto reductase n=1 Tax=Tsukamurella tyrosinosolvens TaxID=57704 RepID=UPI000799C219|nr:aldo/keto reductase [Tsukamurella tyrosinosolvens]KXP02412.1 aldo/keto reductase [Tsukamurella tyrosinosolvens]KZL96550.1 aldo/keto reductase [Tsukamurella tyrosinosolvens]MCA4996440.1 aldo/keto reductase [Tsukamurella tyrosinosolvens]MEC4614965.1 aldo/keto reductase [Tsukamurella tyrosinosolvens]WEL93810.1 aldo/keto reductase [Tsukamurella tyrosinosolvens]